MDPRYYTAIDKSPLMTGFVLIVLVILTGCETTPVPTVTSPAAPAATMVTTNVEKRKAESRIPAWLAAAEIALMNEQLTTPLEDNAYFRYL